MFIKSLIFVQLTTGTVNYYSTIHALELIYFDSNTNDENTFEVFSFFKLSITALKKCCNSSGIENSTCLLVFTSASGCRASENFDIPNENFIFSNICQKFCDAGQELEIFLGL